MGQLLTTRSQVGLPAAALIVLVVAATGCQSSSSLTGPTTLAQHGITASAGASSSAASFGTLGREGKVNLCHKNAPGDFNLVTVAPAAEAAHRAHGDAAPGEAVPGVDGKTFDESCNQVTGSTAPACPCWSSLTEAQLVALLNSLAATKFACASTTEQAFALGIVGSGSFPNVFFTASNTAEDRSCDLTYPGGPENNMFVGLSEDVAAQCLLRVKAVLPQVTWCQ